MHPEPDVLIVSSVEAALPVNDWPLQGTCELTPSTLITADHKTSISGADINGEHRLSFKETAQFSFLCAVEEIAGTVRCCFHMLIFN